MGKALRVKNDRKARVHLFIITYTQPYNRKRNDFACVQTADTVRLLELQYAARG